MPPSLEAVTDPNTVVAVTEGLKAKASVADCEDPATMVMIRTRENTGFPPAYRITFGCVAVDTEVDIDKSKLHVPTLVTPVDFHGRLMMYDERSNTLKSPIMPISDRHGVDVGIQEVNDSIWGLADQNATDSFRAKLFELMTEIDVMTAEVSSDYTLL